MLSFIVAVGKNGVMGKDNQMPWHIPNDFKYFKERTMHHTIVMGRKTFDSIGRVLPEREHIVLTRSNPSLPEDVEIVHNFNEIVERYANLEEEVFIIGGANVFEQFLPYVNIMYITEIDEGFEGDIYFPSYDKNLFYEASREKGLKDERNPYDYEFVTYKRK